MKIAHVNDIAHVPATLAEGLRLRGHTVELFRLKLMGGKLPTWAKVLMLPWRGGEMRSVNRELRAGGFDVVHIHFAYLGWAGILGRYPYVLHCHGTDVRRNLNRFYQRPFIARSLQQAAQVFFSTPDLAEHILPVRPDAVWLPNPTNTDRFCPNGEQAFLSRQDADSTPVPNTARPPRVLFISALSRIKGVERAFQMIDLLQKQMPEAEIVVMGFGDQLPRYRNWPGINVLDRVPYEAMPSLIQSNDVVVGQLRLGIISMSEQEAMACGKPIVGEFRYPEVYDEPPPILTGDTAEELTGQVIRLLNDENARQAAGHRAREWAVKHHDYRLVAGLLESYYESNTHLGAKGERRGSHAQ